MCYSGSCPYELWSGECGKKRDQPCPESFETQEEAEAAAQAYQDELDYAADAAYEARKDRRLGI